MLESLLTKGYHLDADLFRNPAQEIVKKKHSNIVNFRYREQRYLKVPAFIKKYSVDLFTTFIYIPTPFMSNYLHLNVNFLDQGPGDQR